MLALSTKRGFSMRSAALNLAALSFTIAGASACAAPPEPTYSTAPIFTTDPTYFAAPRYVAGQTYFITPTYVAIGGFHRHHHTCGHHACHSHHR
jgi:hypothetical protein